MSKKSKKTKKLTIKDITEIHKDIIISLRCQNRIKDRWIIGLGIFSVFLIICLTIQGM